MHAPQQCTIVVITYGVAANLSGGWEKYRDVLARHESSIRATDSFLAKRHPGLVKVADDFFFPPYRAPLLNIVVTLLVLGVAHTLSCSSTRLFSFLGAAMMRRMFARREGGNGGVLGWLDQLYVAPEPLSRRQRSLAWLATLLVASSRIALLSRSLWDWDEALFSHALQDYDVTQHHPHPPGVPLFIAMAKLVRVFVDSEFSALQLVSLIGAVVLFPLMLLFGRELRMPFPTAFVSASLLVFFPNVWFYGGTAFSDVPSLALVLFACVLLLRGCRSGGSYLAGAFILAVAAGFRPQNLLVGLAPALIATWCRARITRSVMQPFLAVVIGTAILLATFGGAALASGGWQAYRDTVVAHRTYIETIDSFRNPNRPPLLELFDNFFVKQYQMAAVNWVIGLLSVIGLAGGLLGKRKPVLVGLLTFGPFCMVGWLMLDRFSAGRFSVAWAPLIALLAAEGSSRVADLIGAGSGRQRARTVAQIAIPGCTILTMIVWAFPGLVMVHTTPSPPVQAVEWIRQSLPADTFLYVHGSMKPFTSLMLRDHPIEYFDGAWPLVSSDRKKAWVISEGVSDARGARVFSYTRRPLRRIVRHRYFEVSVIPCCAQLRFGEGWHEEEGSGDQNFRWMGSRASVLLPAPVGDPAELTLRFYLPLDAMEGSPTVTIALDGKLVERFVATGASVERKYIVTASERSHELLIQTDRVVNPAKQGLSEDTRDLGLRLDSISWTGRLENCGTTPFATPASRPRPEG